MKKSKSSALNIFRNMTGILLLVMLASFFSGCDKKDVDLQQFDVRFIPNMDNFPVFSWKTKSKNNGFAQLAYQIIISDNKSDIKNNNGNIWDSEKVNGSEQFQIKCQSEKLISGEAYYAKVRLWDTNNVKTNWSAICRFVVPLDYPEDWKSEWITYDYHADSALPVFRKSFVLKNRKDIDYARIYISAPGFYEAFINGEKIGKNVLDPGQTNYEDYAFYTSYDIDTESLNEKNVLGVMLGNGWYNQNVVWDASMIYGQPVFNCQVIIHYKNAEKIYMKSDESWKWKCGPVSFSNIYAGESYDANKESKDWFKFEEPESEWKNAIQAEIHPEELFEQFADPIKKMDSLEVEKIIDKKDGSYIYDFGQNFAGWVRLKIDGEKGQEIELHYVEELDSDFNINTSTTGFPATKVVQTSKYICDGEGLEIWEPRFAYHGFRYVEVLGLKNSPEKDLLTGIVVYSSLENTGSFHCSEPNVNKLHELAKWTIISNIHSIPTDCPHREKCGWTGDSHALAKALIYNFNAQQFLSKYMFDMRSSGREEKTELHFGRSFMDRSVTSKPAGIPTMIVPGKRTSGIATADWGTASVQLPWYLYEYYGDSIMLKNFYSDMKTWVEYISAKTEDGVIPHGLGDWCPPGGNENIDCPVPLSSTAFHILDVKIMKQTAELFKFTKDYEYYAAMLDELKESFNRKFFDSKNYTYGGQTANAMALDIGIAPDSLRQKIAASTIKNIEEEYHGFLNTGIFGLSRIFRVLCENGFEQEVYKILTKKGKNSFAFMWDQYDATTLWEVLPCNDNYNSSVYTSVSHSHPMQAGYDAWFYSGIAGINPDSECPGFKKIVFKPYLTQYIDSASAEYQSLYGIIRSEWRTKENKFSWNISIPENSMAKVYIPVYKNDASIKINGEIFSVANNDEDFYLLGEYDSGEYMIEVEFL